MTDLQSKAQETADRLWEFADGGSVAGPRDFDAIVSAALAAVQQETQEADVDRWRNLYRALAWMVNDYIGVCGISADFTKVNERLGYAHEGFHNAKLMMRQNKPPVPEGMRQGIRCKCWAEETGQFAGTRHEHYDEPPYSCARCKCKAYEPIRALSASQPSRRCEKAMQDHELLQTMDGMKWAQEFCRITGFADEAWALAWFCNAIMTGWDHAHRKRDVEIREFCGWLSGDLPELHTVEVPRIADSLARFNRRCDELAAAGSEAERADQKDGHLAAQAKTEMAPPGGLVDHLQGDK